MDADLKRRLRAILYDTKHGKSIRDDLQKDLLKLPTLDAGYIIPGC